MNSPFVGAFYFFGTLLLIVALIISNSFSEFEKYYIHDDIDFVEVISTEHKDVLTTSDKSHILILTNCLKNIALNNICQSFSKQVSIAPQTYEITFFFADGKTETFFYTVYPAVKYPATKYNQPLRPFFDLYECY